MREIILNNGGDKIALVDDEDYERLGWSAWNFGSKGYTRRFKVCAGKKIDHALNFPKEGEQSCLDQE